MNIFDQTINRLEHALKYSAAKNKVHTHNIANIDTPNYKAKDIQFKTVLEGKLKAKKTDVRHIPFSNNDLSYHIRAKTGTIYNHNKNNVDIDKEIAEIAKNQIYYQSMDDRLNGK